MKTNASWPPGASWCVGPPAYSSAAMSGQVHLAQPHRASSPPPHTVAATQICGSEQVLQGMVRRAVVMLGKGRNWEKDKPRGSGRGARSGSRGRNASCDCLLGLCVHPGKGGPGLQTVPPWCPQRVLPHQPLLTSGQPHEGISLQRKLKTDMPIRGGEARTRGRPA